MDDSHIPEKVFGGCCGVRRSVGRPRGRWEDVVGWDACRFATDTELDGVRKEQRRLKADIGMAKAQKRLEAPYKKKNKKEAICAFSTGKKTRKPTARTPRNYCILRYRQVTTTNLIQGMPGK